MIAVHGVVVVATLRLLPTLMFGALAVILAFVYADVRRTDPRTIRGGPAGLLDASFLLFERSSSFWPSVGTPPGCGWSQPSSWRCFLPLRWFS